MAYLRQSVIFVLVAVAAQARGSSADAEVEHDTPLRFERRLMPAESTYFRSVLMEGIAAVQPPCTPDADSHDAVDGPTTGHVVLEGVFASASVRCQWPDAGEVNISVSNQARWDGGSVKRVIERGDDFLLFTHEYDVAALSVIAKEKDTAQIRHQIGSAAPIRAVDYLYFTSDDVNKAKRVDLARIRTALVTPPRSAIPMFECPPEVSGPTVSRADAEVAVYETVAKALLARGVAGQVVLDKSEVLKDVIFGPSPKTLQQMASLPCLSRSALDDFKNRSNKEKLLPRAALRTAGFDVRSEKELRAAFKKKGWESFYAEFPRSKGELNLSLVGLNETLTQAIVYAGFQAHEVEGKGELYVLTRSERGWEILYTAGLWVS